MKIKSLIIIIFAIFSAVGKSQTSERIAGFTDFRIFFNISSMSAGGDHFAKGETIIPFGAGFEINYNLSKRFSSDFGIEFRSTGNRIEDSFIFSRPGFSGPFYHEYNNVYLDIPIHFNYELLNTKYFKLHITFGPKATIYFFKHYFNPGHNGIIGRFNGSSFSSGIDFRTIEWIKISKKVGIFTSQCYGYYLFGNLSKLESIVLKLGLTYNLR